MVLVWHEFPLENNGVFFGLDTSSGSQPMIFKFIVPTGACTKTYVRFNIHFNWLPMDDEHFPYKPGHLVRKLTPKKWPFNENISIISYRFSRYLFGKISHSDRHSRWQKMPLKKLWFGIRNWVIDFPMALRSSPHALNLEIPSFSIHLIIICLEANDSPKGPRNFVCGIC